MTQQPDIAPEGGSWIREADGTLRREGEPTHRRLPHEPEEPAPEAPAPEPERRRARPTDPVTES